MSDSEIDTLLGSIKGLKLDATQSNIEFELNEKIDEFIKMVFPDSKDPYNTTDEKLDFLKKQNPVDRSTIKGDIKAFLTNYHGELASVISNAPPTTPPSVAPLAVSLPSSTPVSVTIQMAWYKEKGGELGGDVQVTFIKEDDMWVLQQPKDHPMASVDGATILEDVNNAYAKLNLDSLPLHKLVIKDSPGINEFVYDDTASQTPVPVADKAQTSNTSTQASINQLVRLPSDDKIINELNDMGFYIDDTKLALDFKKKDEDENEIIDFIKKIDKLAEMYNREYVRNAVLVEEGDFKKAEALLSQQVKEVKPVELPVTTNDSTIPPNDNKGNVIEFCQPQQQLGCGRHALNNLLGGEFFVQTNGASIIGESDQSEEDLFNAILTLRAAGRDLSVAKPINLKSICKYLYYTEKQFNTEVGEFNNYCPQYEYYNIEVLRNALVYSGYFIKSVNIGTFKLTDDNDYIGFVLNTGGHWYAICNIKGKYYYKNSINLEIGSAMPSGKQNLIVNAGDKGTVYEMTKNEVETEITGILAAFKVYNRYKFTLEELIVEIRKELKKYLGSKYDAAVNDFAKKLEGYDLYDLVPMYESFISKLDKQILSKQIIEGGFDSLGKQTPFYKREIDYIIRVVSGNNKQEGSGKDIEDSIIKDINDHMCTFTTYADTTEYAYKCMYNKDDQSDNMDTYAKKNYQIYKNPYLFGLYHYVKSQFTLEDEKSKKRTDEERKRIYETYIRNNNPINKDSNNIASAIADTFVTLYKNHQK